MTVTEDPAIVASKVFAAPLAIRPESPDYEPVRAFLRTSRAEEGEFEKRVPLGARVRTSWVDEVPEPLRSGLRAVILDVAGPVKSEIGDALADVLYSFAEEVDDGDDLTIEMLQRPITIVDALERVACRLGVPVETWLNDRDLVPYKKVAGAE